jgi:cyclophilin family peptidyl-prolyl cis-trans isomerase|tara:strand:- start:1432 stop:2007 length:576 start_codon:yes stop_codon:yes gene_type:complete
MKAVFGLLIALLLALNPAWSQDPGPNAPLVTISTSEGDITLRLFPDKSPLTVANFLSYVDSGHYEGTIFHRVIPNFMIQGGGFLPDMTEKATGEPIVNESRNRLHNIRGTIAMARTADPDSATAQFFINQRSNLQLDWSPGQDGYTVFGEVIAGMSVVDYIASSPVRQWAGFQDVPVEPILIHTVQRKTSE